MVPDLQYGAASIAGLACRNIHDRGFPHAFELAVGKGDLLRVRVGQRRYVAREARKLSEENAYGGFTDIDGSDKLQY